MSKAFNLLTVNTLKYNGETFAFIQNSIMGPGFILLPETIKKTRHNMQNNVFQTLDTRQQSTVIP